MRSSFIIAGLISVLGAAAASAVVTPPAGYIYSTQLLSNLTEGCVAAGPGGTFVGIGPAFTANAEAVVLAKESGELRLVAMGFNSISDCAYDRTTDTLYVTDNATNADLGITTGMFGNTGAQTGDTVFAIPSASAANGLSAPGLELLPTGTVPFAANVALDAAHDLLVANAAGPGSGSVIKIAPGPTPTTLVSGLQFVGGIAVNPTDGHVFVAENLGLPNFDNDVRQFTGTGTPVPPIPFAGPSFGFGSVDLAFTGDGQLLATGNFGADVVAFDPSTGTPTPFVSGLTFASGVTVDPFTDRVEILSSTFTGGAEDRSLHRFTPVDHLTAGGGSAKADCLQEFYGIELVDHAAVCVDGAACDADGQQNGSCLFPVGFCFDVADPQLAQCAAAAIASVTITAKPASPAIANAAARVSAALPIGSSTCVFSDGVVVPVQIAGTVKKPGKAQVKVQTTSDDGRKDTDVAKLVCQPAP
jgi:hypothetical protein